MHAALRVRHIPAVQSARSGTDFAATTRRDYLSDHAHRMA